MEESALALKFPHDKINTSQNAGVDAYGKQRCWKVYRRSLDPH